jgi:hypothetical protein
MSRSRSHSHSLASFLSAGSPARLKKPSDNQLQRTFGSRRKPDVISEASYERSFSKGDTWIVPFSKVRTACRGYRPRQNCGQK